MYAFIWSFGGICAAGAARAREDFDNLVRNLIELCNEENTRMKGIAPTTGTAEDGEAGEEKDAPPPEAPFEEYRN